MKRYHSRGDRNKRLNRLRQCRELHILNPKGFNHNKRAPLDCGSAKCHICHTDKNMGVIKHSDKKRMAVYD